MTVLLDSSSVLALPARSFGCLLLPHSALMEGEVVHRIYFAMSQCIPIFLQLLPLFSDLGELGEK